MTNNNDNNHNNFDLKTFIESNRKYYDEIFEKLSQFPQHPQPIYYCPRCQKTLKTSEIYYDETSSGIVPLCKQCNNIVNYHYE